MKTAKLSALVIVATLSAGCSVQAGSGDDVPETAGQATEAISTLVQLPSGGTLNPGDTLVSQDGRLNLVMQAADGNLVLYFQPFGATGWSYPLWSSGTAGHPGARAVMQTDGSFVVLAATTECFTVNIPPFGKERICGNELWSSGTQNVSGEAANSLSLQSGGNLVVSDGGSSSLWSSNSAPNVPPSSMCLNEPKYNTYFCPAGSWWRSCQAPSYNPYAGFVDGDANIVVYCGDEGNGWTDNELCQGGAQVMQVCSNDNGTLICTPPDSCSPGPTD